MSLKRSIKRAAVRAGQLLTTSSTHRRVVVGYHSVHPTKSLLSTRPELFESHIQWLKEACHVTSLRELVATEPRSAPDKPVVAITFDDGYEDNHSYVLPLL